MHHLKKHPNTGGYYFRQAIPKALQAVLGRSEYLHSLDTKDPAIARYLGYILSAQTLVHFQELKQTMSHDREAERLQEAHAWLDGVANKQRENQAALKANAKKFEGKFNPVTGEVSVKTDPSLTGQAKLDDEDAAYRWQKRTIEDNKKIIDSAQSHLIAKVQSEQPRLHQAIGLGLKKIKLKAAFDEYKKTKTGKAATLKHVFPALQKWVDYMLVKFPNLTVNQITRDDIKQYKSHLQNNSFNHKTQKMGVKPDTINKKIGFIKTFFLWCQQEEYFPDGESKLPTRGLFDLNEFKDDIEKEREKFTDAELKLIFNPATYFKWAKKPHYFWPPLIGLFTGSRLNEICELNPAAIQLDHVSQIYYVDWHKGLKNYTTKRTVPLHPALIELGLLDYLDDLRQRAPKPENLFPYLMDVDKAVGGRFANYLKAIDVKTSKKVFHSLRHTCINAMTRGGVHDPHKKYYTGHKDSSVHAQIYDESEHPLQTFEKLISKIQYPIDIEKLKYKKGYFLKELKHEMLKLRSRQR